MDSIAKPVDFDKPWVLYKFTFELAVYKQVKRNWESTTHSLASEKTNGHALPKSRPIDSPFYF
jgi:hypothetical protein